MNSLPIVECRAPGCALSDSHPTSRRPMGSRVMMALLTTLLVSLTACDPNAFLGDDEDDEVPEDCDEETPGDQPPSTAYPDHDEDGFGDANAAPSESCSIPMGHVLDNSDCNDDNADVKPPVKDLCNGVDDDCDGLIDEDAERTFEAYPDMDGDGFGDANASPTMVCGETPGFVLNNQDCNDSEAAINPDATDSCNFVDDDCDGSTDEDEQSFAVYTDGDGDGYGDAHAQAIYVCGDQPGYARNNDDCNDDEATVNPGIASDACNFVDDDCDGFTDEDEQSFAVYPDRDGDGYGDTIASAIYVCNDQPGYARNNTDCDDSQATTNPGVVADACNFVDDDCDGSTDEDGQPFAVYTDRDRDGYGDSQASGIYVCGDQPGYARTRGDCNDADASINPGVATDACNFVDDDCDGSTDEDGQPFAVYPDNDGDGYGHGAGIYVCGDQPGYARNNDDCNDGDATVNPGIATDACNFVDDDCDGSTDEDGQPFAVYTDGDGDGYGNANGSGIYVCGDQPGYARNNDDCNDGEATINPGVGTDACNFVDDDCDGSTDEDGQPFAVYRDGDNDGHGDANASGIYVCGDQPGYARNKDDCNDGDAAIKPGVVDACNFVDDDCDGSTDEDGQPFAVYTDSDGDGYGDANASGIYVCGEQPGYASNKNDCDDTSAAVNPGAAELCSNDIDDDCDGKTDAEEPQCDGSVHCGELVADAIWTADKTHVVTCPLIVKNSATVTIKDGTVVKFERGAGISVGGSSGGKLIVDGDNDGVRFTSAEDNPARGDWAGLSFGASDEGSQLAGLTIEYGGGHESSCLSAEKMPSPLHLLDVTVKECASQAAMVISESDVDFEDVIVKENTNDGMHILGSGEIEAWTSVLVTGNGESPLVASVDVLEDILSGSGAYTGNGDDRIHVPGGVISGQTSWRSPGVPLVIHDVIDISGTKEAAWFTIEDEVTLQFEELGELKVGHSGPGVLNIYAFNGVLLTSANAKPSPGDWPGITFGDGESGSLLSGVTIEYGGGNGFGNLAFEHADAGTMVKDCTIRHSSKYGIYRNGATPDLMEIDYLGNAAGDLF